MHTAQCLLCGSSKWNFLSVINQDGNEKKKKKKSTRVKIYRFWIWQAEHIPYLNRIPLYYVQSVSTFDAFILLLFFVFDIFFSSLISVYGSSECIQQKVMCTRHNLSINMNSEYREWAIRDRLTGGQENCLPKSVVYTSCREKKKLEKFPVTRTHGTIKSIRILYWCTRNMQVAESTEAVNWMCRTCVCVSGHSM